MDGVERSPRRARTASREVSGRRGLRPDAPRPPGTTTPEPPQVNASEQPWPPSMSCGLVDLREAGWTFGPHHEDGKLA
jgi:hypothetical protein